MFGSTELNPGSSARFGSDRLLHRHKGSYGQTTPKKGMYIHVYTNLSCIGLPRQFYQLLLHAVPGNTFSFFLIYSKTQAPFQRCFYYL